MTNTNLEIWNDFCNYYDVEKLAKLDSDIAEYIINIIEEKKVKFKGLHKILDNYYNLKVINYNIVYGFVAFHYFESKDHNKKIYLFGEYHLTTLSCPMKDIGTRVSDFIIENIKASPKFIDVFLESSLLSKEKKGQISYLPDPKGELGQLQYYLSSCLKLDRELCNYPNVRVHYVDVRDYVDPFNKPLMFMVQLVGLLTDQHIFRFMYKNEELVRRNFDRFLIFLENFPDEINEYRNLKTYIDLVDYFNKVFMIKKLSKQIQNGNFLIMLWFNKRLRKEIEVGYTYLSWEKIYNSFPSHDVALVSKVFNTLAGISGLYMDLYLMSRIFRKFKKIPYYNSNEPMNIITYTGNYHTKNYIEILNILNFNHKIEKYSDKLPIIEEYTHCVDLSFMDNKLLFED